MKNLRRFLVADLAASRPPRKTLSNWRHFTRLIATGSLTVGAVVLSAMTAIAAESKVSEEFFASNGRFLSLYRHSPMDASLGYEREFGRETENGILEFDRSSIKFATELLLPTDSKRFFRLGASYHYRDYEFTASRGTEFGERNFDLSFHRPTVRTGVGYFVSPRFLLTGFADLGLAGDSDELFSTEAIRLELQGEAVFEINPAAQLVFGLRRGYEFEEFSFYPMFGIRLLDTEGRLRVTAQLPILVEVSYRVAPVWDLYGIVALSGEEYEFGDGPGNQEGSLTTYQRRIGAGVRFLPGTTFVFALECGAGIQESMNFDLSKAVSQSMDVDIGPYLSATIGFSL